MKKFSFLFISLLFTGATFAQTRQVKLPSLGIHFFFDDFQTAADIRNKGLSNVVRENQYSKLKRMAPGLAVSYLQGFHPNFDVAATLSASFVRYTPGGGQPQYRDQFLLEGAVTGNLKLLTDEFFINPYLTAGVGASLYKSTFSAFIPVGVGLQFKLVPDVFLHINSQYRMPITEAGAYHLYYSAGIVAPLKDRPAPVSVVVAPPPPPPVLDRDKDGIPDVEDKCPDVPGVAALQGCPDKDGDGIADGDDACPDVPGLAKYKGCPIPDSDGDGIGDSKDQCPNEAGEINNNGCPSIDDKSEIMGKVKVPEDYIHHEIVNYQRELWFKDGEIDKIIENIGDFKSSHLRLEIKIVVAAKDFPKLYENRKNQLLRMLKDNTADIEKAEFEKIINDEKEGQIYFKLKQ